MNTHTVKSWIEFFEPISRGEKVHELRFDDRNYQVGDVLSLQEYDPHASKYTGRTLKVQITYLTSAERPCAMSNAGLNKGFVILSIRKVAL